ncbi:hypothetical protein [Nostoc sp.]|uniref:hypothetical protein n=1 Tax=Nostoc sp. TaxID=1180 RepID=UPI002FFB88BE
MTRNLDLSNESNWELVFSLSIPATILSTNGSKNYYAQITPITPDITLDKPILAISINTTIPPERKWYYAGNVSRFANSSLGAVYIEDRKPLFLGRFNLVITDNSSNYQLEINLPKWFISCNLAIYQYEGDTSTLSQKDLDIIKAAVVSEAQ